MKQEIVKGAQLTAINVCKMRRTGEESLTIGKVYEVLGVNYNEDEFWIKDDFDEQHYFDISDYTDYFELLLKPNNGWIKIESEEDLPKISGHYFILINTVIKIDFWTNHEKKFELWNKNLVTYYQPIDRPKPPMY